MRMLRLFTRALPGLVLTLFGCVALNQAALLAGAQTAPSTVVISQVYGGGGNSGATFKNDFIELFNPTATTQILTGYSIQYASATSSNTFQVAALPSPITLAPGQYFLIQASQGAGGTTNLPTPDATNTLALSATAGKVALVSSTTALDGTSGCPANGPTVVDFLGYGGTTTAVNCYLGSPGPLLTNTTAALRSSVCVNTMNNGADFVRTSGTLVPHNTASPFTPCSTSGSTTLSATGTATPASVYLGNPSLLTVQVTPATDPASTGITVQADLSAIGGSSSQLFYDDGTHGDVTPNDNTFSYSATSTFTGAFSLPVSVSDAQLRTASTSISLAVQPAPAFVTIRALQSTKPSSYAGQTVTTSGIVVGVKSSGFYLESKDADTTPTTPEGILVYTGSTKLPDYIALGAEVQVIGKVANYPSTSPTPDTEIDGPQTFSLLSTGNPLPAPVQITAAMDSPSGGIRQFAPYEGMRVAIASVTTTSGTDASLTETTETNKSNGQFYGVVTGVPRPFREPGISVTDITYTSPIPSTVPRWDSNPELLEFDSLAFGGPAIDLTSNATVTGITGVMDFSYGAPEIILDASPRPTVTGIMTPQPLPTQAPSEFTVATFNMERFYNDVADADNPGSVAVVVTTEAYQRRLNKASLAVRTILHDPDIVGAQEIENLAVLTDLANKINSDETAAGNPNPQYQPYLFLANDGTAINTGFLVKSTTVDTLKVEQVGLNTTFTNANGGQSVLNDRTPLVLHAGIKRQGGSDYPVTVIDVHQRSLISIDDPTGTGQTVRLKREAQAEFLANLIQGYQAAGEHVITVGDFNSFQFNDGFVDTLGVTRGNPVPASQVITAPDPGLVNPPLIDLDTLLPSNQYSYVETGSAQYLDHILITQDLLPTFDHLDFAHIDADFPLVDLNDPNSPDRVSDHDPGVAYFTLPAAAGAVQLTTTASLAKVGTTYQATITVTNNGAGLAPSVTLTTATLGSAAGSSIPAVLGDIAPKSSASVVLTFPASAGPDHAATVEKFTGTYSGGSFGGSIRATLP